MPRPELSVETPIVFVTGPPASGKSTLAEKIAGELSLPLIAKDAMKETLFDAFGTKDREWSMWMGSATYPLIHRFLRPAGGSRSIWVERRSLSTRRTSTVSILTRSSWPP